MAGRWNTCIAEQRMWMQSTYSTAVSVDIDNKSCNTKRVYGPAPSSIAMDIGETSRIRPCSVQLSKLNLEVLETNRYFKIRAGSYKRYIIRKPLEEKVTHSLSVQTVSTMRSFTDKLNCDNELQSEYLPECINGYLETTKEELDSITRSVDKIDQIRSLYSVTLPRIEKNQCLGIARSRKSKSIDSISNTPSAEKRNALAKLKMSVKNNQHKLCCLKKSLFSTNRQIPASERCDLYSSTDADSEATIIHNEGGRPKRKRKIQDRCRACEEDSRENDTTVDDDTINVECIPHIESLSKSEHLYHHRVRIEPSHKRIKVNRVQNDNTLKVSINLRRLPDDYIKRLLKKDTSIRSIANHLPPHTNTALSDFRSSKSYSSAPLKNLHISSNKQMQTSLQHPISDSESSSSTATTASSATESGSLPISNDAKLATSSNESGSLLNSNGAIPASTSNETGSVFFSNKTSYFGTFNGSVTPILIPAATASNSIGLVLQPILFAATTASSSNGPASAVHLNCATLTTSSNELISSPILFAATLATTSNELMSSPILLPTTTATTSNELMSTPILFAATVATSSNELMSSPILLPTTTASSSNRLSSPPTLNAAISTNSSYGSLTPPILIPTTSISRSKVCVSPSIVNSTTYATNINEVQPMHHVRDETTVMNSLESVLCSQPITSISKNNNASTVSNRLSSLTDNLLDLSKLVKKRQTSVIEDQCIEREFDDNTEREDEHMTLVDIQGYSDASDISVVEEVVCSESTNCDAASYATGPEIACSVTPPPISTTSYLKDALDLENILNQDTQDVLSSIAEERASKKCPYHDELPWASNRRSVTFDIRMTKSQPMHSTNAIDNLQNEDGAIEKILLEMELQSFNYVYGSRCSSSGKVSPTEGSGDTQSESSLQNELAPIEEKYRATYDDNAVYYQMSDKNEFIADDTAAINTSENENPPEQQVVSNMLRLTMIAEPVIISETSETKMQEKGNEITKELSNSIEPLFISVVVNAIKQPPADSLSCHKVNPLIKRWNLDNPYGFSNSLHLTRKNTSSRGSVYLSKIRTSNIMSSFMELMKPHKMFPEILHPLFDANKAEQSLSLVTSPTNKLWPITQLSTYSMSMAAQKLNSEITLNWTVQSFGRKACTITESKQLSVSLSSHAFTNMSPKKTEDEENQDFIEEDPRDGILNAEVNNNLIECQLSDIDKLPVNNDAVSISQLSSDRSDADKRQPRHDNNLQSAIKTEAMCKKSRSRRKNSKPKPSKAQFRHKDISVFPVVQKVPLLLNNLEKIEKYKGIIKNVQKLTKNDKAQKQKLLKDANKSQADSSIFKLATAERLASELPHHNWLEQKYKIQNEQLEDDAPLPIAPDNVPVTIGTATYPIRRKRGYTRNIPKKRSSKRYIKNISNAISTATRIPEKPKKSITLDNDPIKALNAIADLYNITVTTFAESSEKMQDVTSTVKDDNDILRPNGTVIIEKAPKSTRHANDQFIRPSVIKLSGSSPKRPGSISVASWNIPKIDIKDLPPATEAIDLSRPNQTHATNPVHHLSLPFKNPAPSVAVMEEPLSFVVLRTRNTPSPCLEWNFSKSSQVTDEVTDVSRKEHINSMSNRDIGVIKASTQLLKHKVCPRIDAHIEDLVERDSERTIKADAPSPYDRTVENISGLVSNVERAIEIVKNTGVKSSTLTHRNDHGNNVYPDNVATPSRNRFFEQNSAMLSINDFYHNHLLTQRALNLPPLPLATFLDLAREQKRQEVIRTKEGSIHQNIPTVGRYDCTTSNRHVFPEYVNGIPSKMQSTYTSPFFTMPSIPTSVPEVSPHADQYFPKLTTATPVTPQQAYINSQSNMRPNADLQFTNHRPTPSKITPKRAGHDEAMPNRSVFDLPTAILPEGPTRRGSKRKEFWSNPTSSASAPAEIFSSNIPPLYSSSPVTSPANTLVSTYNSFSRSQKSSDDLRYYLRQPPTLTPPQMGSNALQSGRNFVFSNSPYTHSVPFEQCVTGMPEPIRMDIPDPPPLQSKPVTGITNHNISSGNFIAAAAEEPSERVRNRTPIRNGREILNEGFACGPKTNPAVGFAGDAPYGYRMEAARPVYPNTQEFTSPFPNAFQRNRDLCLTCGKPASQWFCHFCSKQWPYCCLPCFEVHRVTCHNAGLKKLKK